MNRSVMGLGIGILLLGFALIAFPIATTGAEQFDLEQEAGLYFLAPAFAVITVGAISIDPRTTTVCGAFGNPDEVRAARAQAARAAVPDRTGLTYHPNEPVRCRYCSAIITADLSQCPRCARPRECRSCGRPLGTVLNRVTCPLCARPEAFCNCPRLAPRAPVSPSAGRRV